MIVRPAWKYVCCIQGNWTIRNAHSKNSAAVRPAFLNWEGHLHRHRAKRSNKQQCCLSRVADVLGRNGFSGLKNKKLKFMLGDHIFIQKFHLSTDENVEVFASAFVCHQSKQWKKTLQSSVPKATRPSLTEWETLRMRPSFTEWETLRTGLGLWVKDSSSLHTNYSS